MNIQDITTKIKIQIAKTPLKFWIIGGVLLPIALGVVIFSIPKQANFSYAEKTCVRQLLIAPSLQKQSGEATVSVSLEGGLSIGNVPLFSTKACVKPSEQFAVGTHTVRLSPGGSWFLAKQIRVVVPEPPSIMAAAAAQKPVSAVRPLEIKLAAADIIHTYTIRQEDRVAKCNTNQAAVTCDIAALDLDHGHEYTLRLARAIQNVTSAKEVANLEVETLTPVHVTHTSVKNEQTVYETVKEITFTADKPLTDAQVSVTRHDGEQKVIVETTTETEGTTGKIIFSEELPRKTTFTLEITQLDAEDNSTLAEPHGLTFATSGGPKVQSASVGASLVPQNARIVLTFDQPIDESVDVTKYVKVDGAAASVARQSATEVVVTLQNAPLCTAFAISVDKGMKSGSNSAEADEAWRLDSRIICGTSSVIGYSVQGRPIIAHYFGSGAATILFTGGIHGSESSGTATMNAWVTYLQSNAYKIPAGKRVVVVPNTNPDGIAAGSRNNSRNVNLGRNFPSSNWKASIETTSGTLPNGGGASPGSEPEAQALMNLTRQLRPRLEVSFHAQGGLVGANKVGDSVAIGQIYADTVRYRTMFYNAEAVMGYEMTGEYEEWMGEEMGIPAILIELPTLSGNYLNSQLSAIMKMLSV